MATATFRIWRGDRERGALQDYTTEVSEGMVVLDAVHKIQAEQANDLSLRWNCKAGKCGSCSAEINGLPKLMCMTRLNTLRLDQPVTVEPMRTFPPIKDLVTDVSWNFRVKKTIKPFLPRTAETFYRAFNFEETQEWDRVGYDDSLQPLRASGLRLTAQHLFKEGIVDQIIDEPAEGAHTDHDAAARYLDAALTRQLAEAVSLSQEDRLARRYAKLRQFGRWGATAV